MKTKPAAPKKASAPCTSTASDGALKCALAAIDALGRPHTVHTTLRRGAKAPTHATWSNAPDGRVKVIEYKSGKRTSERFEGEAPPWMCPRCGGSQCKVDDCLYAMRPAEPAEIAIQVGDHVRLAKRGIAAETGVVRELVDTKRGKRALVAWSDGEQFVDLVALVVVSADAPTTPSLADKCKKCGSEMGEHDGKKCPKPAKAPAIDRDRLEHVYGMIVAAPGKDALALSSVHRLTIAQLEKDGRIECRDEGWYPTAEPETVAEVSPAAVAPLTKIGEHEVHPAAALFPMIDEAGYPSFLDDIRKNFQRKPIVRIQVPSHDVSGSSWLVLDGRNRLRACIDLGREPQFRRFGSEPGDGLDPIAFVISENIHRRHLNETQRSFVGAALVPMYEAQAKERQRAAGGDKRSPDRALTLNSGQAVRAPTAAEQAAEAVNVGKASVEAAIRVNRDADPEVIAASRDRGELKVSAAAELSSLPKSKQREIVEKMGTGEMRAGKVRAHVKQEKKRDVVRKINEQQVAPMPEGPFRVIVVDWPWPYDNADQHEGSRGHIPYPSMSIEQAFAMAPELDKLAHEDGCILGFWTTNAFMPDAVRIVEAWGFSWRTIRTWDKGRDGIGTWCRSRTEHLIIAERGDVEHTLNEISTLIVAPRREHSRKPDEPMESFEKHCQGPHLEMFAREPRPNWAVFGAETEKFATEAA